MSPPAEPKWDEYAIKAEIYRRGETLTSLAKQLGHVPGSLRGAFHNPMSSANRAIAQFLDIPVQELWPDWFDSDGELIPRRVREATKKSGTKASHESHAA